ncbi:MATE family efflux transporter [Pseudodesulfovibrio sediminis]|uniref:Multidrug-efflux transporter n=1 Tax=Pseudodesulfovibrio sediminis TaxID=2810563 RepID=A0ABM7P5Y4_9BACT|nr:MATE family efflux transporter [Pseudodesulfovibrio sediminis]BCS89014.1 MATE family efflux transporter [Pseudodesulfovibrio sediminis]
MSIVKRWSAKGGYKEALDIGLPLVVSMLSNTVMTFTDRIFLGNYSMDTLGASLPASIAAFLFLSFFMGVAEYLGVFVAQYTGALQPEKVGRSMWQGIWFSIPSGLFLASLWFIAEPLFALGGHPAAIQELEIVYFRILTIGSAPFLLGICLSCFFSGRGITKPIMIVSIASTLINIPLDYCLINGIGPFPELGIVGAGLATLFSFTVPVICYAWLIFTSANEEEYCVRSAWRFDGSLMKRFLRFGLPGGVQFFLDIFAITFFVFMVGRLGPIELASTNAVFSIYTLAFLPTIGLHISTSIMVGQAMGDKNPDGAAYATKSVLHIALAYMTVMALLFVVFPEFLLNLFRARGETGHLFDDVVVMGILLMRYAAIFTLIDAVAIIYVGGLKGAGDTRFTMLIMGSAALFCMVIPLLILNIVGVKGVQGPWMCLMLYVSVLAVSFMWRFRKGPWRRIEVIEFSPSMK